MKKLTVLCCLLTLIVFSGCGSNAGSQSTSPDTPAAEASSDKEATVTDTISDTEDSDTAENDSTEYNDSEATKASGAEDTSDIETTESTDAGASTGTEANDTKEEQEPAKEETSVEIIEFERDGKKIHGELYRPAGEGPFPGIIIAHGFGGNLTGLRAHAKVFADNGIAAYIFDFIGGGMQIKSDGKMTEMSVLTEAADYNIVFDGIRALPYVDENNMFVMGESQGGFVSTYIAGTRPADVRGLIAHFPAYVLQDDTKARTNNGADMPDTMDVMGTTIGRIYNEDALSFDIYEVMKNYTGNALLIHGTADPIVPYSYSERAVETLDNAELILIDDAGHGFGGDDWKRASDASLEFVKNNVSAKFSGGSA